MLAQNSNLDGCLKGGRGLSKLVISRVVIRVTPFKALITLLITYLLSPRPLQVIQLSGDLLSHLVAQAVMCLSSAWEAKLSCQAHDAQNPAK